MPAWSPVRGTYARGTGWATPGRARGRPPRQRPARLRAASAPHHWTDPIQWQTGTGPGAGLTAADVDTLVITAAELWDPDGAGADEALSGRQREVLAKARAIHDREYAGYEHSQED